MKKLEDHLLLRRLERLPTDTLVQSHGCALQDCHVVSEVAQTRSWTDPRLVHQVLR